MKRKAMTVKQLARWIAAEIVPDEEGSFCLRMDREWTLDSSRGLHRRTADELATLHDRLSRAIPNDFDFSLEFEDGEVVAGLEFCDGPNAGFHMGLPVALDRHLINALREYEWDELRAVVIPGTQFHDNLTDEAADFPVTLEGTADIQSRHGYGIERFCKDMAIRNPLFAVLSADEEADELEYEVTGFHDRFNLIGEMGDMLACNRAIIAIWAEGASLTPDAVDALRQEALEGLGPISRAKAEGRFWAAAEAMG